MKRQERKGDGVAIGGEGRAADKSFDHAENDSAERRAGNIADAAEHGRDERLDPGSRPMSGSIEG